jgi:hypothetical protein
LPFSGKIPPEPAMTEPVDVTRAETPSAKRRVETEPRRIDRYRLGKLLGAKNGTEDENEDRAGLPRLAGRS